MEKRLLTVAKFGGTSVATAESRQRTIGHIKSILDEGGDAVVVVSAMGRLGQPYATDTLLSLIASDSAPDTRDLMVSCGETISACVLADELTHAGIAATPVTGPQAGLKTDGVFGAAKVTGMDTAFVKSLIASGIVPVITGFQGASAEGRLTTLGRGGSDTSAVEIGGYLRADRVYIYTDVPGIAMADPRVWAEAPYLAEVDYDDMLKLATWGSGVIHPNAVLAGRKFSIPVWVRSTFNRESGTEIKKLPSRANGLVGAALMKKVRVSSDGCGMPLGDGRFASPDGEMSIVTVLCRPTPSTDELGFAAKEYGVAYDGELLHIIAPAEKAGELLTEVCRKLYTK